MARTKATIIAGILERLGDTGGQVWSHAQVGVYLDTAYKELTQGLGLCVDWIYAENLPRGFSYTATWEQAFGHVVVDYGCANFTYDAERRLLGDDMRVRLGPANHTCPDEATLGHLSDAGASTAISATVELPASVAAIARVVWDRRTCAAALPAHLARADMRYETTTGPVIAYTWRKDGLQTLRKYKVPADQATTYTIEGEWGILREPEDLSSATPEIGVTQAARFNYTQPFEAPETLALFEDTGRATFTASWEADLLPNDLGPANHQHVFEYAAMISAGLTPTTVDALWGIPRQIPGQHPMGDTGGWGTPRRPFADAMNVRVEHTRRGRPVTAGSDTYELPDRYAQYLRDYVLWKCLAMTGPGQDRVLAAHYEARWQRNVARIQRRLQARDRERVPVMGGAVTRTSGPARPQLPSNYGSVVR